MISFGFRILCHLNKKNTLKLLQKKKIVYVCVCFVSWPKSLKLPSGLTKLCNQVMFLIKI